MRWFVEISPLGASEGPKLKWCIEAAGWQPALKDVRALRGEDGPLGGFSIELLDDGARAVDPGSRTRYVIREAPADAALTHTKAGPVAGVPPAQAGVPPAQAGVPPAQAGVPPAQAGAATAPAPATQPQAGATTGQASATTGQAVATTGQSVATTGQSGATRPRAAATTGQSGATTASSPATPPQAPAEDDGVDVDIPVDTDDAAPAPALPAFQLLHSREEDPTDRSPLTYREHVYAVAEGTSDADIERLLHARFEAVKQSIASARPGRFVNLAVFDHVFTGKPSRRPRATLAWKDWRDAPEIRFPAAERASLQPPSFAAPTSASQPVPQPSVVPPEPAAARRSAPPSELAPTEPAPAPLASTNPAPSANDAPTVVAPSMDAPTVVAPPSPATAPSATAPSAAAAPQAAAAPKIDVPAEASAARPSLPVSSAPKTMPAVVPSRREAFIPKVKTAAEAGRRASGDDLISELFEACGDLHFARDSLEGADFVLNLALEKLPSEVGLVSLFDINRREFVVVRQAGGPRSVVLARLPERAGLAQPAMRKRSAVVVGDAAKEPRALDDRFRALGVELRSLVVAPVEQSGRYLGLIELLNPVDGRAFSEGDGHALTYIGEQFAEFVAERGVLLDPELVLERHQKR